jgi:thioredoxin 1
MSAINVNDTTFQNDVLNSDVPVLVDFWAPWCAPCRIVAPVLEEIAQEYAGQFKIAKMNTDENMTATKYGIRSIPTMLIFKGGEVVDQIIGAVPKHMIVEKMKYYSVSKNELN